MPCCCLGGLFNSGQVHELEKQCSVKAVQKVGRVAPGGSVPSDVWGFHPTLLSLEGCKSPSMTMHALTSSAPSMHGHGAAALLAEQQSKIIAASASPPPPAIPAECCAEQALLQPPHTKSCLDIYKPRISQIEIGAGRGGVGACWAQKWG